MANTVNGSGPLDAQLWFVGEAPGQQEEFEGKPFVGPSGRFLRTKLSGCGLQDKNVRFENLSSIRPPRNDFDYLEQDEPQRTILLKSIAELKNRIKTCKPNLVVCLGAKPLKYLIGEGSVKSWRGHILSSTELGCKIMCTYHPSACLRQRHVNYKLYPGQFEALFSADLQKAVDNYETKELEFANYFLLIEPSFTEAKEELERLHKEANILSYDIETLGHFVDCIGFCSSLDKACCIPLYHPTRTKITPYWSEEELLEIFWLIKVLLESDIPKIAQNSQYDTIILKEFYGIQVHNLVWDTMVAAHDLYCELPKGLGTLISLYANLPYHKFLIKTGVAKDRWEYNALDALANLHVREGQLVEAKELGILEHYYRIPNAAIRPLVEMQIQGILVDVDLKDKSLQREKLIMTEIMQAFDKVFPIKISSIKKYEHMFNPTSPRDKKLLFYNIFGCKKSYNKGTLSVDKDAMDKIIKKGNSSVKLLAEACIRYKAASSMAGRLKTPLRKGRMHTAYAITGTDTGRLASKESIL